MDRLEILISAIEELQINIIQNSEIDIVVKYTIEDNLLEIKTALDYIKRVSEEYKVKL